MPGGAAFGWSCLGGAATAVVIFVLPEVSRGALQGRFTFTLRGLMAAVFAVLLLALLAGVFALVPDLKSRGQAVGFGLGVNGIIKGIASAGVEAFPGRRPASE